MFRLEFRNGFVELKSLKCAKSLSLHVQKEIFEESLKS